MKLQLLQASSNKTARAMEELQEMEKEKRERGRERKREEKRGKEEASKQGEHSVSILPCSLIEGPAAVTGRTSIAGPQRTRDECTCFQLLGQSLITSSLFLSPLLLFASFLSLSLTHSARVRSLTHSFFLLLSLSLSTD